MDRATEEELTTRSSYADVSDARGSLMVHSQAKTTVIHNTLQQDEIRQRLESFVVACRRLLQFVGRGGFVIRRSVFSDQPLGCPLLNLSYLAGQCITNAPKNSYRVWSYQM